MEPIRYETSHNRTATPTPATPPVASEDLYRDFGTWLDNQLAKLEAAYVDWGTPGYGYWRKSLTGRTEGRVR